MDEKTQARIKKLQALAERGVGGEKETAARKLQELLKKNGISSVEELTQDEYIFTLFSYNGVLGRKLLSQCIYKETPRGLYRRAARLRTCTRHSGNTRRNKHILVLLSDLPD